MKLIKLHLFIHFVESIWMYGSPMTFNGYTGKSHLKAKTKQLAQRTRMLYKDMEYWMAIKDYKNTVLERGVTEIERFWALPLGKNLENCFSRQYKSFEDEDRKIQLYQEHGVNDEGVSADWSSTYFTMNGIEKCLEKHNLVDVKMYTGFNYLEKKFKCYGHLCISQHN